MSDLTRTLTERAERGTPLGSAQLRERVMLELAADASTLPGHWARAPRPLWVFLGAGAAILVLIGAIPLLIGFSSDGGPTADTIEISVTTTVPPTTPSTTAAALTSETPTTIESTVTTTIPVTPARLEITWQQAPTQPAFGPVDVVRAVVLGGPGLVAVGAAGSDRYNETAVWTSPDGFTWERAAGLDGFRNMLDDVANGLGGLVAVSNRNSIHGNYGQSDPPIWISPDGTTWSRITGNEEAFGANVQLSGITAGGPGYVAVGTDGDGSIANAAIWVSADGLNWTRVQQSLGNGYEESLIIDVVSMSSGLVAVGVGGDEGFYTGSPPHVVHHLVWTSQDGLSWNRTEFSPEEILPEGVATVGGTTIAFGHDGDLRNTLIDLEGERLVTIGYTYIGRGLAIAWASDDSGVTWFEVTRIGKSSDERYFGNPLDQVPAGFRAITAFGDGFVAVGGTGNGSTPVWIGTWNEE